MRVYAVVSEQMSDEALELFVDRQIAELMVESWDRDEPDRAGDPRQLDLDFEIRPGRASGQMVDVPLERGLYSHG